jgi:hypothetical protein
MGSDKRANEGSALPSTERVERRTQRIFSIEVGKSPFAYRHRSRFEGLSKSSEHHKALLIVESGWRVWHRILMIMLIVESGADHSMEPDPQERFLSIRFFEPRSTITLFL